MDKINNSIFIFWMKMIVLIQSIAIYIKIVQYGSEFRNYLWNDLNLQYSLANHIDFSIHTIFLLITFYATLTNLWLLWLMVTCWNIFIAFFIYKISATFGAPYVFFAQSLRFLVPLSISYYYYYCNSNSQKIIDEKNFLLIGISLTFAAHGIEALLKNPIFIDYIIGTTHKYFKVSLSETSATSLLELIGIIDLVLAYAILNLKHLSIVAYMAFWGFLTAIVRFLYHGNDGITEMFMRIGNGAVPLYFMFIQHKQSMTESIRFKKNI